MIGYSNIPKYWKEALSEVEDIPFSHTDISLNKAYSMTYGHACDMLQKHGNMKVGNDFIIKREDIRPVALEVAFENLKVSDKLTIEKSIGDVNPFSFEGTGLVVKGYVAGTLPADYIAEMEVYIDGKFYETTALPQYINHRKCELFFCYDRPAGQHTVTFKWKNPVSGGKIWITEIIIYTTK